MSEWTTVEHALAYLSRADSIPHRTEGEAALLEQLPETVHRVLDLGCGDGRLLGLVGLARPGGNGVALDFSPAMLEKARERFRDDETMQVIEHDLHDRLPEMGTFGAVVSSFAIHHLPDERKHALYEEVFALLDPGGVFLQPGTRLLAYAASARAVPRGPRIRAGLGGPIQPAARCGDTARVAAQHRLLRRGLSLEVDGTGAPRRCQAAVDAGCRGDYGVPNRGFLERGNGRGDLCCVAAIYFGGDAGIR